MAATALLDQIQLVIASAVDAAFYREVYRDIDPATHPAAHYAAFGWREGRDPTPWFSTTAYLKTHPDVAAAGVNPFHHFLTSGRREGRAIVPSALSAGYHAAPAAHGGEHGIAPPRRIKSRPIPKARPAPAMVTPEVRQAVAEGFDAAFYLQANPDVAAAGLEPLDHFLMSGWQEGRDPSIGFSIEDYLQAYPDIAAAGLNPFVHFVTAGRAEGRKPRNDLGFRYRLIENLAPVEDRVRAAANASATIPVGGEETLAAAFGRSRSGWRDLHLTFSHDDFSANLGGVQVCLQREAAQIAETGRDHLHLFPYTPWPTLRAPGEAGPLGVWWNGEALGAYRAETVEAAVRAAAGAATPGRRSLAIHNLLGHRVDETVRVAAAAGLEAGYFWLHDFASLCAGFHLLRNDVADCGAPPPDSPACGICAYLPMRRRHIEGHEELFRRLRLTVVAPAESTLATWRSGWRFPAAGEVVAPHARLVERAQAEPTAAAGGPFRFAFLGLAAPHKGWPIFRELALKYAQDPRYAFIHLGVRPDPGLPIAFHPVSVDAGRLQAMRDAVEAQAVDAAMVWPLCRETFSLTAHEAVAAGAAVVTSPDSGNVAAYVQGGGHGWVLPDEAALDAAFETGEILALARAARRPKIYDLAFGGLTADLLAAAP